MPERSGRHDRRVTQEDTSRRHLRAGIAKIALRHKRERPAVDSRGSPLVYAQEMAARHNERTLERWADKGRRRIVVSMS